MNFGQFKINWCPVCNQGWVEIVKEKDTDKLFVCCLECETEWDSPTDALEKTTGTHNKYGLAAVPTYKEICTKGWNNYLNK